MSKQIKNYFQKIIVPEKYRDELKRGVMSAIGEKNYSKRISNLALAALVAGFMIVFLWPEHGEQEIQLRIESIIFLPDHTAIWLKPLNID